MITNKSDEWAETATLISHCKSLRHLRFDLPGTLVLEEEHFGPPTYWHWLFLVSETLKQLNDFNISRCKQEEPNTEKHDGLLMIRDAVWTENSFGRILGLKRHPVANTHCFDSEAEHYLNSLLKERALVGSGKEDRGVRK